MLNPTKSAPLVLLVLLLLLLLQVTPLLRERYFGAPLELQSHENYCPAWEGDMLDATSKPAGNVDGESVAEVSARLQQLFQVSRRSIAGVA